MPRSALAAGPMRAGSVGSDISWPQCGHGLPQGYSFGVVGVTGGRPFTANDCFTEEFGWASLMGEAQLYVNLEFGQAADGALHCMDGDAGCTAYNFGWNAAADAWNKAIGKSSGTAGYVSTWWLDVEIENAWSDDTLLNSYVIQGAIDYLGRMQGRTVGVYSTPYQWARIAADYAPPGVPNWVAGASGLDDSGRCGASLWPGSQVWLVQYLNLGVDLDQNLAC